jgi:hypothetical protein
MLGSYRNVEGLNMLIDSGMNLDNVLSLSIQKKIRLNVKNPFQ